MNNKNKVEILGYFGDDKLVCLSAWQSTNVELGIELSPNVQERVHQLFEATVKTKKKTPEELLTFLAESKHTSPFRKPQIYFQVTSDIATHYQCLKHKVACEINGESARYKELKDKWYLPEDWKGLEIDRTFPYSEAQDFIDNNSCKDWHGALNEFTLLGHQLYHESVKQLTPILGRKRAKESSRFFFPYTKQLDFDMMLSFEAFVNFQRKRNTEDSQDEIEEIGKQMLNLVRNLEGEPFKYSLQAFGLN